MKQQRMLIILVVVFGMILLVGALQNTILSQPIATPTADASVQITPVFEGWGVDNVYAIQIYDPVAQLGLTITRTNDDLWQLVEFGGLLTQEEGNLAAASVALFPVVRILEEIGTDRYDEFGLTQDDLTMLVSVILKDGNEHSVAVGDLTANGDSFYALVDDRPNLYIVNEGPVSFFTVLLRRAYEA
ncbi:hypothetical protein G4Y79_13365 [Phototrophicus methaneseepsis]|uniref:DUF4340 domain-containing protein n=1 Tax=Phototrophicus methaneseepsis TaxID=2710758 RepID=A0A7S8ICP9_9CHLR|nr:hypothetical protein [Phototrophicus methaneseepsis]QPC80701.1 hypothetical protein G4Y79_13365 [Phototrophicus methaneseepsis]